jgi:transmembrane sensor
LDDGSTVALNSRSKIAVHFSRDERDITLVAGQALFHVAKDSTRPFVVKSGDTRVRAVGTEFDVYNKILGTVVTVVEGHVAVLPGPAQLSPAVLAPSPQGSLGPPNAPRNASSASGLASLLPSGEPRAILLAAGEQLTVSATNVERVDHPNVSSATAWTQHQLIFDSASLSEVVLEFNRYNKRPLVVEGPDPDGFHLSGVFSSTDPTSLIQFLRERPGLRILETPTEVRIERNNSHER